MNETSAGTGAVTAQDGEVAGIGPRRSQHAFRSQEPISNSLMPFLRTTAGQISAAVVGVLVAAITGWLSPLGDRVRDALWPEYIAIIGELPAQEHVERDVRIVLQSRNAAGISGGTIEVTSPDNAIELIGDPRFIVPSSKGSTEVPPPGRLKIKPSTSGTHPLHVVLQTDRGRRFAGDIKIVVAPTDLGIYVGEGVRWTGKWHIALNRFQGTMDLIEDANRNLSGRAVLDDGRTYAVNKTSWHDGDSFLLLFDRAGERLEAQGMFCGVTDSQTRSARVLNGKVLLQKGAASTIKPLSLGAVVQRCPQMREQLSDTPGDGVFEAFTYPG